GAGKWGAACVSPVSGGGGGARPLRDGADATPALLPHYRKFSPDETQPPPVELEPGALRTLQAYAWPGNIRELRNFCENAVVTRRGAPLTEYDLEAKFRSGGATAARSDGAGAGVHNPLSVEENEKRLLREALLKS